MASTIDLRTDELLTLAEACRLLPKTPSPATLWRWRTRGVSVGGQRIKLECIRVGGKWCTTRQAMANFLRRQTDVALESDEADSADSSTERPAATTERLATAGLL